MLGGEPADPAAPLQRERRPARVLEGRHQIDELRARAPQHPFERVDAHAFIIGGDRFEPRFVGREALQRREV